MMTFKTSALLSLLAATFVALPSSSVVMANSDGSCQGAQEIDATAEGEFVVKGDTSQVPNILANVPDCPWALGGNTLAVNWYKFNLNTMSEKSKITVNSCNETMYDLDFDFYTGPDCDNLECFTYGPLEAIYCWGEDFQLRSGSTTFETEEDHVYLMVNPGSYSDSQNGPYNLTITVEHLEIPDSPTTSPTNPPTNADCSDIPECGFTASGSPKVPMCWTNNNGNTRTRCKRLSQADNDRFLGCGCCPDGTENNPPSYCTYRNN